MRAHRLLRHLGMLTVTAGLLVAGFLTVGGGRPPLVSAGAGSHIEIAPSIAGPWGDSVAGTWNFANMAPGDVTTGTLYLRSLSLPATAGASLDVSAVFPAGSQAIIEQSVVISSMTLGGVDLLPFWPASCKAAGGLPLAHLHGCATQTALPAPPGSGAEFRMGLLFLRSIGDGAQGARLGPVTFVFTLTEASPTATLPPDIPPPATATPTLEPSAPVPTGTPVPSPTVLGAPGEVAKLALHHDAPAGMDPSAFTLNISGVGGLSGPGPELHADRLAVGVPHTVSLVGPEIWQQRLLVIQSTKCVSDTRGEFSAPASRSFTLALTEPAESVVCTFTSILGDEVTAVGRPTPIPPSTGTGNRLGRGSGWSLITLGLLVGATWLTCTVAAVAARRRGPS